MRKSIVALAVAAILPMASCSHDDAQTEKTETPKDSTQFVTVTFTFGDVAPMTRASLESLNLTDLWVFDYIGDELKTTEHQSSGDGFGAVSMSMEYGTHTLYFVSSRGTSPTVDTESQTITWLKPSDTFWGSLTLTVAPSMSAQSVTLSRVATRLRVTVTDEIPTGAAKMIVTPSTWYYGLNYTTSEGVAPSSQAREVDIPSSYIGTIGQLIVNIFGLSPATEWQTNLAVSMKNSQGTTIGSVTLSDAPFLQNRTTIFSGGLFATSQSLGIEADDAWGDDDVHSW